jgi:uncharacterized protein DUF6496
MAKYGKGAKKTVESVMHRQKKGTLKSGSGRKVTSRKQAIAIALSEAREKGAKVPPPPRGKRKTARKGAAKSAPATRKSAAPKTGARKGSRKTAARKSPARKTAARKTIARKTTARKTAKGARKR